MGRDPAARRRRAPRRSPLQAQRAHRSGEPVGFQVAAGLGGDSINVPSDLTIHQLAELRAASPAAIDMYIEAPDDLGGFVRLYDAAELIRVAAPIYLKFGLRNAPPIYPVGRHLLEVAVATGGSGCGGPA